MRKLIITGVLACLLLGLNCLGFGQLIPISGEINTPGTPYGASFGTNPAFRLDVAVSDVTGDFVVTYMNRDGNPYPNFNPIYARMFNSDGTPKGISWLVSANSHHFTSPRVAIDENDNFVILYSEIDPDDQIVEVFFKRYDASGSQIGNRVFVVEGVVPEISMRPNGEFIVDYSVRHPNTNPEIRTYAYQRFDAAGNLVAGPFSVVTGEMGWSTLDFQDQGEYVIAYSLGGQPLNDELFVQKFNANDVPLQSPVMVKATSRIGSRYSLVSFPNGEFSLFYNSQISYLPTVNTPFVQDFNANGSMNGGESPTDFLRVVGTENGTYIGIRYNTVIDAFVGQEIDQSHNPLGPEVQLNVNADPRFLVMDAGKCNFVWLNFFYPDEPTEFFHRVFALPSNDPVAAFTLPEEICDNEPLILDGGLSEDEVEYVIKIHATDGNQSQNIIGLVGVFPFQGSIGQVDLQNLFSFQGNTWYRVELTVVSECENSDSKEAWVFVKPSPTADAGPDQTICNGEVVSLGVPGNETDEYLWTPSTYLLNDPTEAQVDARPISTHTYFLTVADPENGCVSMDEVTVFVDQSMHPGIDGPLEVCIGEEACFLPATSTSPSTSYTWTTQQTEGPPPFYEVTHNTGMCNTWTESGPKTVTLSVTNACGTFTETIIVEVHSLPEVSISTANPTTYCGPMTLTASAVGGTQPILFNWSGGFLPPQTGPSIEVSPTFLTGYTVTAVDQNGCTDTETILLDGLPFLSPLNWDEPFQNVFTPDNDNSNDEWCLNDGGLQNFAYNATDYTFTVYDRWGRIIFDETGTAPLGGFSDPAICWDGTYDRQIGNSPSGTLAPPSQYSIIVTLSNCNNSITFPVSVTLFAWPNKRGESPNIEKESRIRIYPNPVEDQLTVEIFNPEENKLELRILNMLGQEVSIPGFQSDFSVGDHYLNLNLELLPAGAYLVEVRDGEHVYHEKFIKH